MLSKPVNDKAQSLFDNDFLQSGYYAKQDHHTDPDLIKLGKYLFFDLCCLQIIRDPAPVATPPALAFTDGRNRALLLIFQEICKGILLPW
jgi:hypothetical protein